MGVALSDPIRQDKKSDLVRTLHSPSTSSFIIILSPFPFPFPSPSLPCMNEGSIYLFGREISLFCFGLNDSIVNASHPVGNL